MGGIEGVNSVECGGNKREGVAGSEYLRVQSTFKEGRDDTCVKLAAFLFFVVVLVTGIVFALNVVMMTPMVKNLSRKP